MNNILENKELHLFIIWAKGRYKEKEIVSSINKEFQIVEKYLVNWDKNLFGKNLTSFYGANLPPNSKKEKHCGSGEFLLLTFYDNKPKYGFIETGRGTEKVNLNVFLAKEKFRNWTGGGHKIHSTNSIQETNHNLTLLLGKNYYDYEKLIKNKNLKQKKNETRRISRNIEGLNGWKNLEQLLYVMNSTIEYVVLRNFENMPKNHILEDHADIDFLVRDVDQAVYITNAQHINKDRYKINIASKYILVDFESVGDGLYDQKWQNHILKKRIFIKNILYVPHSEDFFYCLIYHVLFHKRYIANDYHYKIKQAYKKLNIYDYQKCNFNDYLNLLERFISKNKYQFEKPKNHSIFFDEKMINYKNDIEDLSIVNCNNIKPFQLENWKNFSGFIYFTGKIKGKKKVFIKSRGIEESSKREYKVIQVLRSLKKKYFPKAYYFRKTKKQNFVVMEYINGSRLDQLIETGKLYREKKIFKENIYNGIFIILKTLHRLKIVHRDIRPQNIIIKDNGTPILIDFQFAVDVKRKIFKEYKLIRKKPRMVKGLGSSFAKNRFHWDDAYSVSKIFDLFKFNDDKNFDQIKLDVSDMIGKYEIISTNNNFFSKLIVLTKNYFSLPIILIKLNFYKFLYLMISTEKHNNKIKKFKKKLFEYH
jgi:serine/threonine protein kinase